MTNEIKLGSLSAVIERQILEVLNDESPLYFHQIGYQMVPRYSAGLSLPLSHLVYWNLIDEAELCVGHRMYMITEKGKQLLEQLKGELK